MPYLQLNDKQVQLRIGETRIGAGPAVDFRLPGLVNAANQSVLAIADLGRDNLVAIRRAAPDAVVRVNGVQLGAEPTPLIHGDKIEISGAELYYGDDKRGGSTQFIPSANIPDFDRLRGPAPARATVATGGRVISLVDGREYLVAPAGLVFGRDASCDVVIPSSEVSRRHAEIVAGDTGYVVTDTSTNGLFVNGDRIEGMQILGRGDVLRIGPEEFRFYADVVAPAVAAAVAPRGPTPASSAAAVAGRGAPPPAPVVSGVPLTAGPSASGSGGVVERVPTAVPVAVVAEPPVAAPVSPLVSEGAPSAPPPAPSALSTPGPVSADVSDALPVPAPPAPELASQPPLSVPRLNLAAASMSRTSIATLEVIGGSLLRGQRYAVTTVLSHLGRGEHNDIIIPEESVSDSHAKLQRRDGIWYVTDLSSTNGTYVGGRRIDAEVRLEQTADLRLGGVKFAFTVAASEPLTEPRGATREFAGLHATDPQRAAAPARASGGVGSDAASPESGSQRRHPATLETRRGTHWLWLVLAIAVAAAAVVYLLQGR
jgi:pSer/pThr/pTyr-binding forkhead associated (FHA) protein